MLLWSNWCFITVSFSSLFRLLFCLESLHKYFCCKHSKFDEVYPLLSDPDCQGLGTMRKIEELMHLRRIVAAFVMIVIVVISACYALLVCYCIGHLSLTTYLS